MALSSIERIAREQGALAVGGAPEGVDAMAFVQAARLRGGVNVFVARDDARAAAFAAACAFFAPDLHCLRLPAWDCLPYDRVSPSPEIAARRAATLSALARRSDGDATAIVVTTVSAVGQRTPPKAVMAAASFATNKGARLDQRDLIGFLAANGYSRAGSVMERGDYAVRGGVVDLFPPGAEAPVRIDLFGDEVDALRTFDPETQRSEAALERLDLSPASEALLTPETISTFRRNYMAALGRGMDDPVYEAISAGSRIQGMEHWLPLFYEQVETPFEYFGPNALIALDYQADEAWADRLALIRDYHEARTQAATAAPSGTLAAPAYRALPPDALYLDEKDWAQGLERIALRRFGPFAVDGAAAVDLGGRQGRNFAAERAQENANVFDAVAEHVEALRKSGKVVLLTAWSEGAADRMADVLAQHGVTRLRPVDSWQEVIEVVSKGGSKDTARAPAKGAAAGVPEGVFAAVLPLEHGFETADIAALSEQDILGDRLIRSARRKRAKNFIAEVSALSPGDLVVHVDHGIARYVGLKTLTVMDAPHDCLELEYSGGDKLFLPVENVELLSRYGADSGEAALDRLGGAAWQARKARAKQRLRDMADQLIRIAAQRAMWEAEPVNPPAGVYDEFAARFPYSETEDQLAAIEDVFTDMAAGKPMDRLICGDVGFGKTEVALRAAFVMAMTGRQVAVIAPTTLLARQHYKTFSERFRGWPVKVRPLSRLVPAKEAAQTREMLKSGQCDIVVGTHALLSKQVGFKDLGLLVIDEEQRFGVKHKERLKEMRTDTHVLTLSATPIPRTLQQALTGIRELSIISTPPVDRLAVRTYVAPFDAVTIREALLREKYRGGQSFFVVPKIADLPDIEEYLRTQVPEVSFIVAHGQMAATQLEDAMTAFYEGRYDVLLSTTIVESGLDIPTANTLVIHRADMFGLAQLYQLRGRVGRSKQRAYAYLTTPAGQQLTGGAERRLKVLHSLDSLGAGFMLASHDLDLRGGGNLLGEEQSGHIRDVGVELYQQMLEEAVASLRAEPQAVSNQDWSPAINAGAAVLIPEDYVPDLDLRLQLYRRLSRIEDSQERQAFAAEMIDRFGPLPDEVKSLLQVVGVKALCKQLGVEKLDAGPKGAVLAFRDGAAPDPAAIVGLIQKNPNWKMRPDSKVVVRGEWETPHERLSGAERVLKELAKAAEIAA